MKVTAYQMAPILETPKTGVGSANQTVSIQMVSEILLVPAV